MRLQSEYAKGVEQESSGLKSSSYQGISSSTQKLLTLETEYSELASNSEANQTALDRLNSMYSSVQSMIELMSSFKTSLSSSMGSASDDGTIAADAESTQAELAALLNTQLAGNYLFSGGATNTIPVDLSDADYSSATVGSTADTDYYQGGDYIQSVKISENTSLKYGITADNPAFEEALRALNLVLNNSSDSAALEEAYGLLDESLDKMSNMLSDISSKATLVDNKITKNTEELNTLDGLISDIKEVDLAEVLVRLTNLETQIEASYSISTKILQLTLTDYI